MINQLINTQRKQFDIFYKKLLNNYLENDLLSNAMIYGSMNGGKRIRPFLVSTFSKICNLKKNHYQFLSAAIECIHSYSLIHDDLPSMDNDDYRRGKKSTHKKFNEATAILAGDALHDLAFEILTNKKIHAEANKRLTLINELAKAIGFKGLAGGQSLDLRYENIKVPINKIIKMYEMKTAVLFSFSCYAPFILANKNKKEVSFAKNYGKLFGLLFQITDDILDEEQNFQLLGKTPGKDKKQGKSTLISISNKIKLKEYCLKKIKNFEVNNKVFLEKSPNLTNLLYFNLERLN